MTDRLLRLVSRLVPTSRRADWLREWRAELAHLRRSGEGAPESTRLPARHLAFALEDAVGLRIRNPGSTGLQRDLRYAVRGLVRRPGFAILVVGTLALGIGANTAVFSLLWDTLLRPLPYRAPHELVALSVEFRYEGELLRGSASEPEYLDLRGEADAFRGVGAYSLGAYNLGGLDRPRRVAGAAVSPDFLGILGVTAALGRDFRPGDAETGASPVALVTHDLWQGALGGASGVLGREILVDGRPRTVVGVLPPDFEFPVGTARILVPLVVDSADLRGRSSHYLSLMARLAPGLDPGQGQARLDDLLSRWAEAYPGRHDPDLDEHPIRVAGLRDFTVGDTRAALYLAMGAVALVLLIACANVANLMIARAESRKAEMALRRALGAGRKELIQQLLVESLVLGVSGAAGGVAVGLAGRRLLEVAGASFFPGLGQGGVDPVVLGFAAALGLVTSVAFGLAAAFLTGEGRLGSSLRRPDRSAAGGGVGVRRILVVAQVGTAVLLVVGAGLLLRSISQLQGVDPGFDPEGVVVAGLELPAASYPEPDDVTRAHHSLALRLRSLPGVEAVGAVRFLPLRDGPVSIESIDLVDRPPADGDDAWVVAGYQVVTPGYFRALRIPLLRGRLPEWSDDAGSLPVAVINRTMARTHWPGGDPLGRRFRLGPEDAGNPVLTVVGVVGDVRQAGLTGDASSTFFVPRSQASRIYGGLGTRFATVVVRGSAEPASTLRAVRQVVRELDPDLPLVSASSMDAVMARAQGDTRSLGLLLSAFSVLALVLGAVGIYGLMAWVVSRRIPEIGIRIALGARPRQVVGSVLRQALVLAALGAVLGVVGALAGGRALEGVLYGVGVRDPLAFAAGPAVLLAVAGLAALLPASRAARIDPSRALRQE